MKQTALILYGSLTLGLVVTLFGSFEPFRETVTSELSSDWFGLGIVFNGNCGRFDKPILTDYGDNYKVEQLGISCKDGSTVYQFKSLDPNRERIEWDPTNIPDSVVISHVNNEATD